MVNTASESSRVLVIRHEPCSSIGLLGRVLRQQQIPIQYLDTAQGEILTEPITHYSHIVVLGGAISAYEEEQYPFLHYEFKLLAEAIDCKIPTVGICLGSQILAKVLGASVYRGASGREAGWCTLNLTDAAASDRLLKDFPPQFRVFQSHQDTFDIPKTCVHLATSDRYPNQAFRYQDFVWAIQFHLEIDDAVLADCAAVIEQELKDSQITDTTLGQLLAEAKHHAQAVVPLADSLVQQFLQVPSGRCLA